MKIKVLGLCSYPVESAATRYRLIQYVKPLAEKEIELTILPFLDSRKFSNLYRQGKLLNKAFGMLTPLKSRLTDTLSARKFDIVFVQREAMMFGPPIFEWLIKAIGNRPLVLDLDDATYVRYISPTLGRVGSAFKFFGKTDTLINWSEAVICGNRYIAEYVEKKGKKAIIVPTVVDTDVFRPTEKKNKIPIIGWIGTHSTFPLLKSIFPVLQKLSEKHRFILKIIGSGGEKIEIKGVRVENLPWNLEREVIDFQSLDIGLYPIQASESAPEEWILGKSGFKAIQYLACGTPFVMAPIGFCGEIGIPNVTHFNATHRIDWYDSLDRLLADSKLRKTMGESGREYSLAHYTVPQQTKILSEVFHSIGRNSNQK